MEAPLGRGGQKPYKEIFESRLTISGIWVWTAPIILWHSNPARTLAWIIPERSQASRTTRSVISRIAILAHFVFLTAEMDLGGIFIRVGRAFWVAEVLLWCMDTSQKFSGDPKVSEQSPSRASTAIEAMIYIYMPYLSSTHLPGTLVFLLPARKSP